MTREKPVNLLPLQKQGDYKPEPQLCKCSFGDSQCIKKNNKKKCPSNLEQTNTCGGWQPRDKTIPLRTKIFPNTNTES